MSAGRTPHQEYVAALAEYTKAKERLIEAKRHYDPKSAPEAIAIRNAKAAEYRAKRRAAWNSLEAKAKRERELQESLERSAKWIAEYERRHWSERKYGS